MHRSLLLSDCLLRFHIQWLHSELRRGEGRKQLEDQQIRLPVDAKPRSLYAPSTWGADHLHKPDRVKLMAMYLRQLCGVPAVSGGASDLHLRATMSTAVRSVQEASLPYMVSTRWLSPAPWSLPLVLPCRMSQEPCPPL